VLAPPAWEGCCPFEGELPAVRQSLVERLCDDMALGFFIVLGGFFPILCSIAIIVLADKGDDGLSPPSRDAATVCRDETIGRRVQMYSICPRSSATPVQKRG
jgi:hypothetical protein